MGPVATPVSFCPALLACLTLLSTTVEAQQVAGRAVERGSDFPVTGAYVALEDSVGTAVDAALTDDGGRYRLRARGPGTYTIRVQRIGFETWRTERFRLRAEQTDTRELRVPVRPVKISGVLAASERRCRVRPDDAPETARLWTEAHKALEGTAWTGEEGLLEVEVRKWKRRMTPDLAVVEETSTVETGPSADPFVSPPAAVLANQGYVQSAGEGRAYYAPDASALLSDAFQETHCFWTEEGGEDDAPEDWLGLAFKPVPDHDPADIRGVIWLDRGTAGLRRLDFSYVRADLPDEAAEAGGRVLFHGLPNGAWIVSRWVVRMPRLAREEVRIRNGITRGPPEVRTRRTVTGWDAEGGEVVSVRTPAGEELSLARRGAVVGRVMTRRDHRPLGAVTVRIAGTDAVTRSDVDGRFRLDHVAPGRYTLLVRRPEVGFPEDGQTASEVEVNEGETERVHVSLPSATSVLAEACRNRDDRTRGRAPGSDVPTGAVVGRVSEASGRSAAGAEVTVRWRRFDIDEPRPGRVDVTRGSRGLRVRASEEGRYLVCGVPGGQTLKLRARADGKRAEPHDLVVPPGGYVARDLVLREEDPERSETARRDEAGKRSRAVASTLSLDSARAGVDSAGRESDDRHPRGETTMLGRVVDARTGAPLRAARVRVAGRRVVSDSAGRFLLTGLRPGRSPVEVEYLGYAVRRPDVFLPAADTIRPTMRIQPDPVQVADLRVTVERTPLSGKLSGFWRRKERGMGAYVTREDLERAPGSRLSQALRGVSGMRVQRCPPRPGSNIVPAGCYLLDTPRRAGRGLGGRKCDVAYVLDGAPIPVDSVRGIDILPKSDVAAVEVYSGPAQIPTRYAGLDRACGAVVIWTRTGGR